MSGFRTKGVPLAVPKLWRREVLKARSDFAEAAHVRSNSFDGAQNRPVRIG